MTRMTMGLLALLALGAVVAVSQQEAFFGPSDHDRAMQVQVTAKSSAECAALITVTNGADQTLKSADIAVRVFERGNSAPVLQNFPGKSWTRIVRPHGSVSDCWELEDVGSGKRVAGAQDGARLITQATVTSAAFYRPDEAIPQ